MDFFIPIAVAATAIIEAITSRITSADTGEESPVFGFDAVVAAVEAVVEVVEVFEVDVVVDVDVFAKVAPVTVTVATYFINC